MYWFVRNAGTLFNETFIKFHMEKTKYEKLKDIKTRLEKGEKTTFAERNLVKIIDRKKGKGQKTH